MPMPTASVRRWRGPVCRSRPPSRRSSQTPRRLKRKKVVAAFDGDGGVVETATTMRLRDTHAEGAHTESNDRAADVLEWARETWDAVMRPDDDVVDATLGRGRDCARVVERMLCLYGDGGRRGSENASSTVSTSSVYVGRVFGFDVEEEALRVSRETLARVYDAYGAKPRATLTAACHSRMEEYVPADANVGLVMFNLGYLPGDDSETRMRRKRTQASSTRAALESATRLVRAGGCVTCICYLGHEGGAEEHEEVKACLGALSAKKWTVTTRGVVNRKKAPVLYVARKLLGRD